MSLADIGFWIRSAKTDAELARLQKELGTEAAFDRLYRQIPDPWGYMVPNYRYQRLKYQKLMAALPKRPYGSALDIGCGLGVFTRMLSPYVERIVGVELSGEAVRQADILSVQYANVRYEQSTIYNLGHRVGDTHDLIVLADILYYLSPLSDEVLQSIVRNLEASLQPGGILLLANHFFFDLDPQSRIVRQIHEVFQQSKVLEPIITRRHPFFLVSTFARRK